MVECSGSQRQSIAQGRLHVQDRCDFALQRLSNRDVLGNFLGKKDKVHVLDAVFIGGNGLGQRFELHIVGAACRKGTHCCGITLLRLGRGKARFCSTEGFLPMFDLRGRLGKRGIDMAEIAMDLFVKTHKRLDCTGNMGLLICPGVVLRL